MHLLRDRFHWQEEKSTCSSDDSSTSSSYSKRRKVDVPTSEEKKQFLDSLASSKSAKPAVLSVISGYCDKYLPSALSSDLPSVLTDLYNSSYLALNYYDLLCKYNCCDCNC